MDSIGHKDITARKIHRCNWCLLPIEKGEVYSRQAVVYEGTIFTWKNHKSCADIASKLDMFSHCDEGLSSEEFHESIREEYANLMFQYAPEVYEDGDFSIPPFKDQLEFVKNHYKNEHR